MQIPFISELCIEVLSDDAKGLRDCRAVGDSEKRPGRQHETAVVNRSRRLVRNAAPEPSWRTVHESQALLEIHNHVLAHVFRNDIASVGHSHGHQLMPGYIRNLQLVQGLQDLLGDLGYCAVFLAVIICFHYRGHRGQAVAELWKHNVIIADLLQRSVQAAVEPHLLGTARDCCNQQAVLVEVVLTIQNLQPALNYLAQLRVLVPEHAVGRLLQREDGVVGTQGLRCVRNRVLDVSAVLIGLLKPLQQK